MNNAAITLRVQVPLLMHRVHLFGYITISWVAGYVVILIFLFASIYVCDGVLVCVILCSHVCACEGQNLTTIVCLQSLSTLFNGTDSRAEPEGLELAETEIFVSVSGALDSPELTSSLSMRSVAYPSLNLQDCLAISLSIEPFLQFLIFNC